MPDPSCRFEDGPALEPQAIDGRPEAVFDYFAGSIEGVQDGGFRFVPLLFREEAAQLGVELLADPLEPDFVFLLGIFRDVFVGVPAFESAVLIRVAADPILRLEGFFT
jgi:hypothetical protein